MSRQKGIILIAALGAVGAAQTASAQSLTSISYVGYTNPGTYINALSGQWITGNGVAYASLSNMTFSGLDAANNPQMMTFSGWTSSESDYGQLHNATYVDVTNNYYNASNPAYDPTSNTGSPYSLNSLGFSIFSDTLQFGGALQSGYQAQYVFHIDGSVTGNLTENDGADIGVNLAGQYFEQGWFGDGSYNTTWATGLVPINGITPQQIQVQFSTQAYVDNWYYADGSNDSGTSDFSDTAGLVGIEIYNANGQLVSPAGITVGSASGTQYALLPEPAGWASMGIGLVGLLGLKRRRR